MVIMPKNISFIAVGQILIMFTAKFFDNIIYNLYSSPTTYGKLFINLYHQLLNIELIVPFHRLCVDFIRSACRNVFIYKFSYVRSIKATSKYRAIELRVIIY